MIKDGRFVPHVGSCDVEFIEFHRVLVGHFFHQDLDDFRLGIN